jgi:hypothetical protein
MIARLRRLYYSLTGRSPSAKDGRAASPRPGEVPEQRIDAARERLKATIPPPDDSP